MRRRGLLPFLIAVVLLARPDVHADYKQAVALFSQGKYDRALEAIKPEVEANPNWEFGHRLMGLCYVQLGQNSLAVGSLGKAVQLKSQAFAAYQGLAQAHINLGKYGNAIESLAAGEAFAKTPEDRYNLLFLRGTAQVRMKKYPEAVADLTGALKVNNAATAVHVQLGSAYLGAGNYPEAIAALERAEQLAPGQSATKEYLARAYELGGAEALRKKEFGSAVALLQKARDLKPGNGSVQYNLGSAYMYQERYKEAADALVQAGTAMPANAKVWERLGFVYEMSRDLDNSLAAYQKANSLNPTAQNQESIERINKRKGQSKP